MKKNIDLGILISRISLGVLMLFHGSAKLLYGLDFIKGILAQAGVPSFIAYGVILGEVVAPILIITVLEPGLQRPYMPLIVWLPYY